MEREKKTIIIQRRLNNYIEKCVCIEKAVQKCMPHRFYAIYMDRMSISKAHNKSLF